MTTAAALIAATRFGFAPAGDDLSRIAGDPRGWLTRQLGRRPALLSSGLPPSAQTIIDLFELRRARRQGQEIKGERRNEMRRRYLAEVAARMNAAIASQSPLLERLVFFWSNHFTVSARRPVVLGFAGAFEREAIRPYVTGRFLDMLRAVVRHPAMGFYLDNVVSVGPESRFGRLKGRGINENLGRELLELHTLGVDGGYTQADVEALARILTGWTVARPGQPDPGTFRFAPAIHEPGDKVLLGHRYAEAGVEEGERALAALARHPATAHHLATKLTRHFIADEPPPRVVERIARVFRDSDGDLRAVTAAIIRTDEAWRTPFAKVRTPTELVIAACRVAGLHDLPAQPLAGSLKLLDQLSFFAPSPAGWPDVAAAWVSPESVLRRVEWCQTFAGRLLFPPDPAAITQASFGDAAPAATVEAIRRAPSRRTALALLLASPQFQRR